VGFEIDESAEWPVVRVAWPSVVEPAFDRSLAADERPDMRSVYVIYVDRSSRKGNVGKGVVC
jgi:hypothetical protein